MILHWFCLQILWKEVDSIVYQEEQIGYINYKLALTWAFNKSVLQVILGIAMLTFLSGPLSTSTRQFSSALGVPSFFISFVIIPIAMNARRAISAIYPASQKTLKTSSLTFSEVLISLSLSLFFLIFIPSTCFWTVL